MRTVFAIFSLLVLVGCGKNYNPDLNRPHVNKDLQIYVNRFVQVAEELGRPVSLGRLQVEFVPSMEGNVIGKCYYGTGRRIEINRSYWERSNVRNSDRESLMFHELGHCILNRGHDDRSMPGYYWLEISIMNSYHLSYTYYENNWQYYMKELFGIPVVQFVLGATSQFPGQYYDNPSLVPDPVKEPIFCKLGSNCEDGEVYTSIVYETTEDNLDGSFHCGESHEH